MVREKTKPLFHPNFITKSPHIADELALLRPLTSFDLKSRTNSKSVLLFSVIFCSLLHCPGELEGREGDVG